MSRLNSVQKQQLEGAMKDFSAQHYGDALVTYKQILAALPGDAVLSKFLGEAALNVGDTNTALTVLRPIAAGDANDWQAVALLTRACAESGDTGCRDAGMAHMQELQRAGVTPPQMQQYILEHMKIGENSLLIRASLVPWGRYKVYDLGQVSGPDGAIFLRISLESSDTDQPLFARDHPQEAAAGMRLFSLDAYRETGLNGDGKRTQTHYTYKFFTGEPSYTVVRQAFLDIVGGKANPVSSRTNLVVR
jgi:hypothetical protein